MIGAKDHQPHSIKSVQQGMATVELAIALSVLFLLILAILDGGRLIYAYNVVSHTAREGLRYVVVRGTEAGLDDRRIGDAPATSDQVRNFVHNRTPGFSSMRITTTWPQDSGGQPLKGAGQVVEVRVEYDFEAVTPFFQALPPLELSSTTRTVIYY